MPQENQTILFFDGICGLCNRIVDFVLAREERHILKFSPLQSEFAKKLLPSELTENLDSLVVLEDGKILLKSDAVLAICRTMGGVWKAFLIFKGIPKFIRDFLYDLVAKNRYSTFGKKESCRMPTAEERARFIL